MECNFYETPSRLVYEFTVYPCEGDSNGNLKLSRILQLNQTAGEIYCEHYGLTYSKMVSDGYTIIMNRCFGSFSKPLTVESQKLIYDTMIRRLGGARIIRDTIIRDANGDELCRLSLESACMDLEARRIIRPTGFKEALSGVELSDPWKTDKHSFSQGGFKMMGSRRAYYSDIDCNRHVNNAVYSDIAMDFLPFDNYNKIGVKSFSLNFIREIRLGEQIEIYAKDVSDNVTQKAEIYGQGQSGRSFEFFAEFWK